MMSKASLQQGRRAVIAEGGEEAAVAGGGGVIAMGAVPVGAVGTEGATSSAVAVGYRRGRLRVRGGAARGFGARCCR